MMLKPQNKVYNMNISCGWKEQRPEAKVDISTEIGEME